MKIILASINEIIKNIPKEKIIQYAQIDIKSETQFREMLMKTQNEEK